MPKADSATVLLVRPRLNVPITVNGSMSRIGPLLPSAYWSVIRYFRSGLSRAGSTSVAARRELSSWNCSNRLAISS